MENIIKTGRYFYAVALVAYGIQQFYFGDFRPVFVPAWQAHLPALTIWAYVFGGWLAITGLSVIFEKKAKETLLITGGLLLVIVFFVHIPFEIISDPYSKHLVMWTNAFKELALSGGAFVIAGTLTYKNDLKSPVFLKTLESLIPYGSIFFSITMITFGIQHFLYPDGVAALVPGYFPYPVFWTYFSAVMLILSGLAIIFKIKVREIAALLSVMIFLWVFLLHIPRAMDDPSGNRGNELASTFDALAFSGIALVIAFGAGKKIDLFQDFSV